MRRKIVIFVSVLLTSLFLSVWLKTQVVRSGYRLEESKESLRQADLELSEIEIRMHRIKTYSNAVRRAKAEGYLLPGEYDPSKIRSLRQ
ncbi:MAG: hypothetical protein HY747_03640 [Elusimicrobia bacterium]|nr:hypothetical protein [Elusimicrobiota bacterium]